MLARSMNGKPGQNTHPLLLARRLYYIHSSQSISKKWDKEGFKKQKEINKTENSIAKKK